MTRFISGFVAFALMVAMAFTFAVPSASATGGDDCVSSGWTTEQLANPWVLVDERTVVDKEAYDEQVLVKEEIPAQHYSLKGNSGIGKDEVPSPPPADYWQANTSQEPHDNNPNVTWYETEGSGLHYTSNESNGKRDWFYFQPYVKAEYKTVHHDAVTHQEYLYEKCEDKPETVTPAGATLNPPTCDEAGSLVIPVQPEGVTVDPEPGTYGPGVYHVDFEPASDEYVIEGNYDNLYHVKGQLSGPECEEPVEPTEFSVTADSVDKCGTANDNVIYDKSDDRVVWTKPVDTDEQVVLVASDVRETDNDILVGQTRFVFNFDTAPCDTDKPDEPKKNEPGNPAKVNSPDVPTAVDAGLASVDAPVDAPDNGKEWGLLALGLVVGLGLGAVVAFFNSPSKK